MRAFLPGCERVELTASELTVLDSKVGASHGKGHDVALVKMSYRQKLC